MQTCEREEYALGLCNAHYQQFRLYGKITRLDIRKFYPKGLLCRIEGCGRPVRAKGVCTAHYERLRKHGDVLAHIPVKPWWGDEQYAISSEPEQEEVQR